jgi:hypothetical protein
MRETQLFGISGQLNRPADGRGLRQRSLISSLALTLNLAGIDLSTECETTCSHWGVSRGGVTPALLLV